MSPSVSIKRADIRVFLCLFAVLLLCGVWVMTLYELRAARRMQVEGAERDARSFARVFEEHTARTVESADQAVMFLAYRYNALGAALDFARDLQSGVILGDIYNLFSIVDEHGDVILSSKPFTPTNLSDREHIKIHATQDNRGLFISKPVLGRVSQRWSLQMTRRINRPDGSYKGVVVVSMDPLYFTRLYHDIDIGEHGSISLVGADGTVRARHSGSSDAQGQDMSFDPLFKAMQGVTAGTMLAKSTIDGRERLYAFRRLKQYPLFVTVGIDLGERLAPYYTTRAQALQLAILTSVLIIAFTGGIIYLVGRLIASREQAIAANRAKSRFLSNMSHELRTPLNGILGYSELLSHDLSDPEPRAYASAIHESGQRLLGLIESVLDLSALESGRMRLTMRPEDLQAMMEETVFRHTSAAAAKGLPLTLLMEEGLPRTVMCDRQKLQRVLDCLLHNAVAVCTSGKIVLSVSSEDEALLFQVIDQGPGIPLAEQRRIFESFSQADESDSRAREGAGIGLSIARQLVELMGGRIGLKSTLGSGSIFSFRLLFAKPGKLEQDSIGCPILGETGRTGSLKPPVTTTSRSPDFD